VPKNVHSHMILRPDIFTKFYFIYNLKDRMGLDIDIVPENEADSKRAALAEFGPMADNGRDEDRGYLQSMSKSLFPPRKRFKPEIPTKGRLKAELEAARARQSLASEILQSSRATNDPFLAQAGSPSVGADSKIIIPPKSRKRKRGTTVGISKDGASIEATTKAVSKASSQQTLPVVNLVDYDSD
jgi:coiled-coil domain-containing protein 130